MATIKETLEKMDRKLERKFDTLEEKAAKEAEKKIMRQRITVMVAGLNFWERLELALKIFA